MGPNMSEDYNPTPFHEAIANYKRTTPWLVGQNEFDAYTKGLADIVLNEQIRRAVHVLMKEIRNE